jgi:hypothetical protein
METTILRPNAERANIAIVFLVVQLIASLALAVVPAYIQFQMQTGEMSELLYKYQDFLPGVVGLALIVAAIGLTGTILLIRWFRRAYFNLHSCGIPNLRHSEGWAAGAWFVPILNWVWPYQIMVDIWNFTQSWYQPDPNNYEHKPAKLPGIWWTLTIGGVVLGFISAFAGAGSPDEVSTFLSLLANISSLAASVVLIQIIRQMIPMEAELERRAQQYNVAVAQQREEYERLQRMQQPDQNNFQ